jgi:hypothetical protein
VFGNMRTVKGEPFVVLCGPIYDCLCTIINDEQSTDDDYECLLLQVSYFQTLDTETLEILEISLEFLLGYCPSLKYRKFVCVKLCPLGEFSVNYLGSRLLFFIITFSSVIIAAFNYQLGSLK